MARVPQFDANYTHCSDLPLIMPNGSNPWASHHVKQTTGTSDTHGWVKEPDIVCKKTATTSDEQRLHMPVTAWMVVSCNVGSAAHAFLRVAPKRRKGRSPSGTSWRISSRFAQETAYSKHLGRLSTKWALQVLIQFYFLKSKPLTATCLSTMFPLSCRIPASPWIIVVCLLPSKLLCWGFGTNLKQENLSIAIGSIRSLCGAALLKDMCRLVPIWADRHHGNLRGSVGWASSLPVFPSSESANHVAASGKSASSSSAASFWRYGSHQSFCFVCRWCP